MSKKHKSRMRFRPEIQVTHNQIAHKKTRTLDDFLNCKVPGCKNIIARESGRIFCSRCKF